MKEGNMLGKKNNVFHLFVVFFGLAFLISSILVITVQAKAAQKELLLGTSLPLTGPGASYGIPEKRAQEIAVDQINRAGGITVGDTKYVLKLLVEDNKYSTKDAVATVNKLVRDEGVRFMRVFGTAPCLATLDFMNKSRIINGSLSSNRELISPNYPYTFRAYNTSYEVLPPLFLWVRKNVPQIKTIQSVMMDDATGKAIGDALLRSSKYFGLEITVHYVPRKTMDFYPILTQMLANKPDAIYAAGGSNWGLVYKSAREMGFKGQFLASTFKTEWWKMVGPEMLEGYIHCEPSLSSESIPKGLREYREIYLAKYNEEPSGLSSYGFIWTHVLATAINKAGGIDNPDKIKEVLETESLDTMAGTYVFGGKAFYGTPHQLVRPGYITRLTGGKEKIIEIIPAEKVAELLQKVY
jgi:branched-chain amino acid transport system substrate-binding protein